MAKFKTTSLELDNSMPKELSSIVENKWHYCLDMEKEIRESTLAHVMPDLTKDQISKASKKHGSKFAPKYRAFNILHNKIKDVVKKSTQMWKLIYGLATIKEGQEDPFEGRNYEEEVENEKEEEGEKEKVEVIVEKEIQKGDEATTKEHQQEQSVQDTQLPPHSPPHTTPTSIETIIVNTSIRTPIH